MGNATLRRRDIGPGPRWLTVGDCDLYAFER
jgi:hypothetical protein